MAPWLTPRQFDKAAGKVLAGKIAGLGIQVHLGVRIEEVVLDARGRCASVRLVEKGATEPVVIEVNTVVVPFGVRLRDELARGCGLWDARARRRREGGRRLAPLGAPQ